MAIARFNHGAMRDDALPDEILAFDRALGVVKYSFFFDANDSDAHLHGAILWHLSKVLATEYGPGEWINPDMLATLPRRVIDRQTFFGPRFDPGRNALIRLGLGQTEDGRHWENPSYDALGEQKIANWRMPFPEPPSYTYAFTQPIYPLQLSRSEAQDLFRKINSFFLPEAGTETILDWSDPALRDLCVHFVAGTETAYWGAYLYTIFDAPSGRLTVISASTGP